MATVHLIDERFVQTIAYQQDAGAKKEALNQARAAKQPRRKHEHGREQCKHAVHRDTQDAKRQSQQPDKWIGDQRQQRDRPAEDEQEAPEHESKQGSVS